jgi:hypothetical protein
LSIRNNFPWVINGCRERLVTHVGSRYSTTSGETRVASHYAAEAPFGLSF